MTIQVPKSDIPSGQDGQNSDSGNGRQQPSLGKLKQISVRENLPTNGQNLVDVEEGLSVTELAEIWARRAYALAEEPPPPATGQPLELLVFWLGGERYGLEVGHVREIYPLEQLTPVPRTPDFVAGVFSARGRILSVIDLRAFLGLPAIGLSDQTKIIVVANTDLTLDSAPSVEPVSQGNHLLMEVGILADEVADVVTVFKEEIEPSLTTQTGAWAEYMQGVTSDLLVVLNLNVLLNDKRLIVHEEML